MAVDLTDLVASIRNVPDFPTAGIQFKDISPVLSNSKLFDFVIDQMSSQVSDDVTVIAGIEARGFIFAPVVAHCLGLGFVPIRKPNKLPRETFGVEFDLEYGSDRLEMHQDAVGDGVCVHIIDDVLATGGTLRAACDLVELAGATVRAMSVLIELEALDARKQFTSGTLHSLVTY